MTTFKMSYDDFQLLSKYITSKCKGTSVKFEQHRDTQVLITVQTELGETSHIAIYDESTPRFAEVSKLVRLGDEV